MPKLLMTVEDTFQIDNNGLVIVPCPLTSEYTEPVGNVLVKVHRPDGSAITAYLLITHHFQTPPAKERRWSCMFRSLQKGDVPVGSEIWVIEA